LSGGELGPGSRLPYAKAAAGLPQSKFKSKAMAKSKSKSKSKSESESES
jgi:hypothetical protein